MRRYRFTLFSAISLALCIALLYWWATIIVANMEEFNPGRLNPRQGPPGAFFECSVIATSVLPLAWVLTTARPIARRFRKPPGLCVRCGYDLRATPQRCPECGTVAQIVEPGRSQVG